MIYVEPLRRQKTNQSLWAFMVTDKDLEELHEFALKIQVPFKRFTLSRIPHYILNSSRRKRAVRAGAGEIDTPGMIHVSIKVEDCRTCTHGPEICGRYCFNGGKFLCHDAK